MILTLYTYEREHRRRLIFFFVVALLMHFAFLFGFPKPELRGKLPHTVGYKGPLRVFPQVSIPREKEAMIEEIAARFGRKATMVSKIETKSERIGEESAAQEKPLAIGMSPMDDEKFSLRTVGLPVVRSEDLVFLHLEKPRYPPDALRDGIEGKALIKALVDINGNITGVTIAVSTGNKSLDKASVEAVLKCVFKPYKIDGKPNEVVVLFPITFRILE